MIGEIRKAIIPFYDLGRQRLSFKSRPALLIAKSDDFDYVALPVSSITRRENLDLIYDIEVVPASYPNLNLHTVSYIRTHKQTIVNAREIGDFISNIKEEYPDLYSLILEKREDFSKEISKQAGYKNDDGDQK